jgi:hypothetical protein
MSSKKGLSDSLQMETSQRKTWLSSTKKSGDEGTSPDLATVYDMANHRHIQGCLLAWLLGTIPNVLQDRHEEGEGRHEVHSVINEPRESVRVLRRRQSRAQAGHGGGSLTNPEADAEERGDENGCGKSVTDDRSE